MGDRTGRVFAELSGRPPPPSPKQPKPPALYVPPPAETVLRYAMAALVATTGASPKALTLCRKGRRRAVALLVGGEFGRADDPAARAAARWLSKACETCGKCPGVVTPPLPARDA